jgi:phage-related protein
MEWSIEYYSPKVEEDILNLPDGLLARYFRLTELMMEFGANLGMPHTQAIENGLFELRIKSKEGIARAFYCTKVGKRIIVLHVFIKKTEKIPKKELELANKRMMEVAKNDPR